MCVHMSEFSRPCTLHRWEAYLVSFYLMIWYPSLVMYRTKNTEVYSESFSDSFKFSTFSFCVFQTHLKIDFLSIYTQSKNRFLDANESGLSAQCTQTEYASRGMGYRVRWYKMTYKLSSCLLQQENGNIQFHHILLWQNRSSLIRFDGEHWCTASFRS